MVEMTIVMNMVTTIEQAVHPLFLIFHILGLGIHTLKKPYLSIFYNVTLWIVYGYVFYYVIVGLKVEKWFLATFTLLNILMNFLVLIISIIVSSYQHKEMRMFVKKLATVDNTLEELGTPKIYRKFYVCIKWVLIGWLVCSQTANIIDMMWWSYTVENQWCMIIPYITNHYQHVNMLVDLAFIICLWYIGNRFDNLNEHMRCLLLIEEHDVKYTWKNVVLPTRRHIICIKNYKHVLWTTMHLHLELCQLARELNAMFKIQMTMEMITYLACLTRLLRYIFLHIIRGDIFLLSPLNWIDISFWISLYIARLFCLNYICESVSAKSNEINTIIHQLTDPLRYADIRDEIYQFTLQTIHHPLKFTGLGLFYFGNGFLRKFFSTIMTYVIIIIQSKVSKTSVIY
ncbi:putative gustatory receptor 28b [Temnothorax longispinosus]|uniref:putative gustatory receptor 28b n=1 Tax=Temnothorax longispinosus TaxID=300112 RepID=UPI003A98F59F